MSGKRVSFGASPKDAVFKCQFETYISHPRAHSIQCMYCGRELGDDEPSGTYEGTDGTLLGFYHINCRLQRKLEEEEWM